MTNRTAAGRQAPARIPNPAVPRGTRPAITDRALRYRAHRNPPPGGDLCAYCGAAGRLDLEHIDGHEENGDPANLLWACRPCNAAKGAIFAGEGIGRLTRQYNPRAQALTDTQATLRRAYGRLESGAGAAAGALRASIARTEALIQRLRRAKNPAPPKSAGTLGQWKASVSSLMGIGPYTPAAAVKTVQRTPATKRASFARQLARRRERNPGAPNAGAYFHAIQILRGETPGDTAAARTLIDETAPHNRSQWTRAAWRTRKEVYGPSGRRQEEIPF